MKPAPGAGFCIDSSVAIAGFASWHEHHQAAAEALAAGPLIVAHAAVETYSVLTRLPEPHRAEPRIVDGYISGTFNSAKPGLTPERQSGLVGELAAVGVSGGAVYDAIVALSAGEFNLVLLSLDRRAAKTYRALDAEFELLG